MHKSAKLLMIAFFCISTFYLNAQVSLGFRAGYNWANIDESSALEGVTPDFKNIGEYNFGFIAEIDITEQFSFQPELSFIRKGFELKEGFDFDIFGIDVPVGVSAESRFNYIEVPLLAKYKLGTGPIHAYVAGGPTIGYATGGKLVTTANLLVSFDLTETPIDLDAVNMNRFEVGGMVGAGFELEFGFADLFVDARYSRGFTAVHDLSLLNEKVTNQGFGMNVGFMIPINASNKRYDHYRP